MALITRLRGRAGLGAPVDAARREVFISSLSLVIGKVAVMGFGFLAWVVAARLYPVAEFGLASGAVAAVTLCAQLALLGIGSAIITLLPIHDGRSARLLDVAVTLLLGTSVLAGLGFLLFAGTVLQELRVVAAQPAYAGLFLILAVCGTLGVLFDQASTARRQGTLVMARGVAAGLVTLVAVAWIGFIGTGTTSLATKVWLQGTTEPTPWLLTTSDTTAALQAAGAVGLGNYLSSSSTNAPVTVSFDDFTAGPRKQA